MMNDPVPTGRRGDDAPHPSGEDRIAIYRVWRAVPGRNGLKRARIAETSLEGLGLCLLTLHQEDEFQPGDRIGLFDREKRNWLINPFGGGSP